MPVENGDRVRVDKLEEVTAGLGREVATLGGELHTHMDQTVIRDRNMTGRIEATLDVVTENSLQLGILVALDEDRWKRGGGLNGKTKVAAYGAGGLGGLYLLAEAWNWAYEFIKGLQ